MVDDSFNQYCEPLLVRYGSRNTDATRRHIEGLCTILRQEGDDVVQTMFGGSVRRGTYVNGLSDIDVLLIVNQSSLVNQPPADVLEYVKSVINQRMSHNSVASGDLAVTVGYADGSEIQILPAIRTRGGVRIAEPGNTRWSKVLQPERFAEELRRVNQARHGRVVPTIKLAKALADCYIRRPSRKIAGYHIESLAIEAFRDYKGPLDSKTMLRHLFGNSIRAVLTPIADSTGQSSYVDEYLGPANSRRRRRVSIYFGQIRAKINSSRTRRQLDSLFCAGNRGNLGR